MRLSWTGSVIRTNTTGEMKTTKNADDLKNEGNLIWETVPDPSLHKLSFARSSGINDEK